MKIEKRQSLNKLQMHRNIVKKNNRERNNYMCSLDKYLLQKEKELKIKKI